MKLCSRLLMFLSKFLRKNTNLDIWTPFWGSSEWRTTLVDGSLESPCSTFYSRNFALSITVPSYQATFTALLFSQGVKLFALNFYLDRVVPINHSWRQKTRDTVLPGGEDRFLLRLLVLTQYWSVTDRETDGQTDRQADMPVIKIINKLNKVK